MRNDARSLPVRNDASFRPSISQYWACQTSTNARCSPNQACLSSADPRPQVPRSTALSNTGTTSPYRRRPKAKVPEPVQCDRKPVFPACGHLAALDFLQDCRTCAGHPKRQGNLALYTILGNDFLATWRLRTSWKAAGELLDTQNDKRVCLPITSEKDFMAIWQLWTPWKAAAERPDIQNGKEIFVSTSLKQSWPFGGFGPPGRLQASWQIPVMTRKSRSA